MKYFYKESLTLRLFERVGRGSSENVVGKNSTFARLEYLFISKIAIFSQYEPR